MADVDATSVVRPYVAADRTEMVRVTLVGLLVGVIVPLLGLAIASGVIKPLLCGGASGSGVCAADGAITGYHIAAIVIGVGVVALFANWGVFRPLPLVVGVTVALWGFRSAFDALSANNIVEFSLFLALLSAICYALFYWLMRLRNFPASMVLAALVAGFIYWTLTV